MGQDHHRNPWFGADRGRRPAKCLSLSSLALCVVIALCPKARASGGETEDLKRLTLEQLGNIEVTTASKEPEKARKTSAAIYVLTQEDLQRSGATSVPEALRLVPGVEVARIDSNRWSIGIRGFGSRLTRDVLVLIDGRTVYTTLLAGTYWEVQNLMMEDIERIEIIRGPGGTIWGPNAVNGVINIITKHSRDTQGLLVSAGGGSLDQGRLNVRFGGRGANGLSYRAYGMGFLRAPEFHSSDTNYDSWRAVQGGFRLDLERNPQNSLTLQGDLYAEGAGERVTATTYAPPYSQILAGTADLSGGNILARWHHSQGEGKDFQLQAFYDRANRHELNFTDLRDTFDIDFLDRFRLPGAQQISWGFGARWSRGTNPTVVSGLFFLPRSRTDELYTGFVEDSVALVENRLEFSFGTKLLKTNYTGVQLQPNARLLFTPNQSMSFWAAFTHAVRTPSDAERAFYLSGFTGAFLNGLPLFARFNANPQFHSEELNGYELGYRQLFGKNLSIDVAAFYNHYGDLFSEDITGGIFLEQDPAPAHYLLPAQFGNGLVGTTRGIEVAPDWRPRSWWRLRTSYSFLQMQLRKGTNSADIGTAPFTEGGSPRHQATVQSGFDFGKSFSLDLTYRYVSHLPAFKIPAYSTADAQFSWRAGDNVRFSLIGQNLFQPHHVEYPSDPGPNVAVKRAIYGQISWQQ